MANFNLSFRPRAGVSYHLIHGATNPDDLFSGLAHEVAKAIPGSDDGIFQTRSARDFGGGPHDRLITFEPHGILTDRTAYWYWAPGFTTGTYRDCLEPMFITRRLTAATCGAPSVQSAAASVASEQETSPVSLRGPSLGPKQSPPLAMTDATPIEQKTARRAAILPDTTTVVTQPVRLVEATRATFLSSWISGTVELTLVDPNGTVITPTLASLPPGVATYNADETHASYAFTATQTGLYTMQLRATETFTTGLPVSYFAGLDSAYTLTTARSRNWLPPGAQITVTAVFTGPTPIANPQVTAHVRRSDGVFETLALNPTAAGAFAVLYTAPNAPGYITMDIVATGDTPLGAIERAESLGFTVYPNSFKPNGQYAASVARRGLTINVGIHVPAGVMGDVRVTGILTHAATGAELAVATTLQTAPGYSGDITVPLLFDGAALFAARLDGPYRLRRLLVVDEWEHPLVSADELNVYTTAAIDVGQFALLRSFLPMTLR
jgi:hypothetical protein